MAKITLIDKLCIYGNHYFVLSDECFGCYHFNYLCAGPCDGECPAGCFNFDKYQLYAEYLIYEKLDNNTYLFARLFGADLKEDLEKLKNDVLTKTEEKVILEYNKMISAMEKALSISDLEIERLKKEVHVDIPIEELEDVIDNFVKEFHVNLDDENNYINVESEIENINCNNTIEDDYDDIPF